MAAKLLAIAGRAARRAPMIVTDRSHVSTETGLAGDFKGAKHKTRQITVLAIEDWEAALATLPEHARDLPWTVRRANFLVSGLRLPRVKGAILSVGAVRLEVTGQTYPCRRMNEAYDGLLKALAPEWRGGVTCSVLTGGPVQTGDEVKIESAPPEPPPRRIPG